MDRFITFTLKQRVVVNLLFILLIVVGALTLLTVPVDRYPNIQFGKMYINTFFPGGSPEEVETLITKEIETALQDLDDIDYIRSGSYRERSNIVIKFTDDSDYLERFDDVRIKVLAIAKNLPERADPPVFNLLDVGDWFPTVSVNISGQHTNATLKLVAEEIKIPLALIPGVSKVKLLGAYTREFHILLDADKLNRYGITFTEVTKALGLANVTIPAGHVLTGGGEFTIRVDEQFKNRNHVIDTIIRTDGDGSFIRIGDIIEDAFLTSREPYILASTNGEECVTLQILKSEKGNALQIARQVKKVIKQLQPLYAAEDVTLTVTQDSSTRIKDSMRVLGVNLLAGTVLVCVIIWIFMGFRNAALTTIGIPFAFLVTLIFMALTGNSINEVSLFAFVLVSGIIVDDAIVVVENIYRHIQMGKPVQEAITNGTAEVFLPVVSATLTTVAAFLPMLLMTGMVGDFFAIIPKTIVFALIASLLECLIILPCHYLEFGHRASAAGAVKQDHIQSPWKNSEGAIMRATRSLFNRLLLLTLRFRFTSQLLLLLFFAAAVIIFTLSFQGKSNLVRIQFFPDNYSLYYVELFGPSGTPIEQTNRLLKKVAKILHKEGQGMTESALGFAGYYIDDDFTPQYGSTLGHVAVTLPSSDKRKFADYPQNDVIAHLQYIREILRPHIPEQFTMVVRPEKDGPPTGKDISIRILGTNNQNISLLAQRITSYLKQEKSIAPWLMDMTDDQGKSNKIFQIQVRREKAAELGLDHTNIASLAATVINGQIVGTMKLPEEQIDVLVKVAQPETVELANILDMPVIDHPIGSIRLRDLCTFDYTLESGVLNRFQQQRAITLTTNIQPAAPYSPAMVVHTIQNYYETIRHQYPGATLLFSGEHESTQKSFLSLTVAFIVATLVIYLILAAQFRSYLQPLIIISAVIFALTGVIFGIFLSRTLFTINSFVAILGVTGVVVNDSLVLVAFLNSCYTKNRNRHQALIVATHTRLRPILLTTLTTTLGLLPMALGIPEYSNVWGSMAMTFVTGLCTATVLTIIIIPVQWDIVAGLQKNSLFENKPEL